MLKSRTKFSLWLAKERYTTALFADKMAEQLGVESFPTDTIAGWRSGKSKPRDAAMIAIKAISNGELTADDFLIDPASTV